MKILITILILLVVSIQPVRAQTPAEQLINQIEKLITEFKTPPDVPTSTVIHVRAGSNLQDIFNTSPTTNVIFELDPVEFVGNFVLRGKSNVIIRTRNLTLPDRIVQESDVASMAKILSPNNASALHISHGVGVTDIRLERIHLDGPANSVLQLGSADGQTTLDVVPRRITLDQISVKGQGAKNGIELQSEETTIIRSFIRSVSRAGTESHCILAYNGPGNYTIENNHLLGSHIGILIGGATPRIPQIIPSDIRILGNRIEKHSDWTPTNNYGYAPKNAIECKACRRVVIEWNIIDRLPAGGQAGWAIVFTASQETAGSGPWAIVENVTFRNNIMRNIGGGFNILGYSQHQSERPTLISRNISITNNFIQCDRALGGHGALAQIGTGPINLHFENNTTNCNGDAILRPTDRIPVPGFRYTNNLNRVAGTYGIFITGLGGRGAGVSTVFPDGVFNGNTFVAAHPTFRNNFPLNNYIATCSWISGTPCNIPDGLFNAEGYGIGELSAYGRQRP